MHGDLYRPLGLNLPARASARPPMRGPLIVASLGVSVLIGSLATAFLGQPTLIKVDRLAEAAEAKAAERASAAAVTVVRGAPMPPPRVADNDGPIVISGPNDPDIDRTFTGGIGFRVEDPTSLRQDPSVAYLPDPALIEETAYGPLPIRDAAGRRPFDVYAGASSGRLGTRVAIVVGGLGISQTGTQAAIKALPAAVTFGFSPAGNSLDRWMQAARRGGHELLLQVPLEPIGYPTIDPGENTLLVDDAAAGRFEALDASLGSVSNYVGVLNYMGGRFTGDGGAMKAFLSEIGRRGLMYLDDGSSLRSVAGGIARTQGVPEAASDVVIDRTQDPVDIRNQLDELERIARAQGSAIGIASAFDVSIQTIARWIDEAEKRGVEIVPVTALADDPERY